MTNSKGDYPLECHRMTITWSVTEKQKNEANKDYPDTSEAFYKFCYKMLKML